MPPLPSPAYVVMSPPAASRVKAGGSKAEADLVASIKKFVADHKIKYKHLAEVEFIEAIPKTPSGKLLRRDRESRSSASGRVLRVRD